jgi:hypothetical protein
MTVSALARNASGPPCRAAIPESVLSDFKALRRHFRVSRTAKREKYTQKKCILAIDDKQPPDQLHTQCVERRRQRSSGPGPPMRPARKAELSRNRRGDVGEA